MHEIRSRKRGKKIRISRCFLPCSCRRAVLDEKLFMWSTTNKSAFSILFMCLFVVVMFAHKLSLFIFVLKVLSHLFVGKVARSGSVVH